MLTWETVFKRVVRFRKNGLEYGWVGKRFGAGCTPEKGLPKNIESGVSKRYFLKGEKLLDLMRFGIKRGVSFNTNRMVVSQHTPSLATLNVHPSVVYGAVHRTPNTNLSPLWFFISPEIALVHACIITPRINRTVTRLFPPHSTSHIFPHTFPSEHLSEHPSLSSLFSRAAIFAPLLFRQARQVSNVPSLADLRTYGLAKSQLPWASSNSIQRLTWDNVKSDLRLIFSLPPCCATAQAKVQVTNGGKNKKKKHLGCKLVHTRSTSYTHSRSWTNRS